MKRLVIESLAAWEKYRPSWQELTVNNVMLSCDWLQAWWKNYGGGHDLYIVALEHEGRLVSFVPWYKHRSRLGVQLRFLGSGRVCSDYLSAVCCPSQQVEARKTLMTHLRNTFASRDFQQEINGLKLEGFAADDAWLAELREMTTKLGYTSRTTSLQNAWRIPLPSTWEQFVTENKSKSLARKIKRCESRLRSGQVAIQSIESLAKLEEAMACFRTLHRSRRESVGDGSCFDDIRFEPFLSSAFASLLDQGKARFLVCEAAGKPIGIHLHLRSMQSHQVYQTGVDPAAMKLEPGHVLVTHSIRTAIEEGASTFDFLRGDEPYKAYWGAIPQPLVTECITAPSWKAQAFDGVYQTLKWFKSASGRAHGHTA